jgi:hypothetical protein
MQRGGDLAAQDVVVGRFGRGTRQTDFGRGQFVQDAVRVLSAATGLKCTDQRHAFVGSLLDFFQIAFELSDAQHAVAVGGMLVRSNPQPLLIRIKTVRHSIPFILIEVGGCETPIRFGSPRRLLPTAKRGPAPYPIAIFASKTSDRSVRAG